MSKKKVILSTIALLLVMAIAVSVVSYSIATIGHGDKTGNEIAQNSMNNLGAEDTNYITNIDLIIENAIDNGETFNVVEIVPIGVGASSLKTYVESNSFGQYVISNNKSTETRDMPEDSVKYKLLTVGSATKLADTYETITAADGTAQIVTVQNLLDKADLIYLNSPNANSYNTNDISEEVFNHLRLYALSHYKPVIMDYVTSSSTGTVPNTLGALVNEIKNNYVKFRTIPWDTTNDDAVTFFSAVNSYYMKFNVNQKTATGNILVITNSDTPGTGSMAKLMQDAGDANVIKNAYFGLDEKKPTSLNYTIKNVSDTDLTVADLETAYDFILIEADAGGEAITPEVATKLRALSESSKYILYDSRLATSGGNSSAEGSNNYLKLMKLLISDKGKELFDNVLAISHGFFDSLVEQGADGVDGAKKIAELIDGSVYRNSAQTGAGGKKYRVLEIQPSYPVDLNLAVKQNDTGNYAAFGISGGYYTEPDQVLYGVTKDEVDDETEYYAFEMSKAKISYATGIPYGQIQVDQMSANELISSKEVLAETYDMVYIGGDSSAYVPAVSINYQGTQGTYQQNQRDMLTSTFSAFDMYTHTGQFVEYKLPYSQVAGGTNVVSYNGNDLTTIKLAELEAYVNAGLPVIVDKVVTDAFARTYAFDSTNPANDGKGNRLEQLKLHDIDPDCNMYKFLKSTYDKTVAGDVLNVGWGTIDSTRATTDENGISASEQTVENPEKQYGETLGNNVTVYADAVNTTIKSLYDTCAKRPKLTIKSYPKQYVEGDRTTTNYGLDVAFKVGVDEDPSATTDETYTVSLYIDKNGDAVYSEGEEVDTQTCSAGGEVDLSFTLDKGYVGLVNWKVKVSKAVDTPYDEVAEISDVRIGNAYFKETEDAKKKVRVLQVMPVAANQSATEKYNTDGHSLYFCTECQQAGKIIKNNITANANDPQRAFIESYNNVPSLSFTYQDRTTNQNVTSTINLGKHEHDFGVVIYDSTTLLDDLESNFADSLTHGPDGTLATGDFEIDLDIVTVAEFEEWCATAKSLTDEQTDAADKLATSTLLEYNTLMQATAYANACAALEEQLYIAMDSIRAGTGNAGKYKDVLMKGFGYATVTATTDENGNQTYVISDKQPGQWMRDKEYYKFWEYFNNTGPESQADAVRNFTALVNAYNTYITLQDEILTKREQYKMNLRQSGNAEEWLLNSYEAVVLGLADEFNSMHLSVDACGQLKSYTSNGGIIVNSHDTITAKAESQAAMTMSDELRAAFGMDRFHVTGVKNANGEVVDKLTPPAAGEVLYRQYITENSTKYFWTERLQAASPADYASVIANGLKSNNGDLTGFVKINAPVGITDMFAAFDCKSNSVSLYRYAAMAPESYDHKETQNVDLWNYEAKYGTRRAERVNEAGVTMFPFSISDELIISPTHGQTYSLDLEDPTVAVWFTLAPTQVDPKVAVDAQFARYVSSFYAASPRDGMSNYFLYSKENVYYTGAGHQLITGRLKDNNDERKLFINTILNAVTKVTSGPQLKLYNVCDENVEDSGHENCDCNYVDPKNDKANAELSKQAHTLYYDKTEGLYEYNIYDTDKESYPEFDFKAIAGSSEIKEIKVFYDLDYRTTDSEDVASVFVEDDEDKNVLIASFDEDDNMDEVRVRLREELYEDTLQLDESYFANYNNCTYIVIHVKDKKNKWQSARIRINILPYLFDLTDATSDSKYQEVPLDVSNLDMQSKKKFSL